MSTTMSKSPDEPIRRIEVTTSVQRCRRCSVAEKVRLVEEDMQAVFNTATLAHRYRRGHPPHHSSYDGLALRFEGRAGVGSGL